MKKEEKSILELTNQELIEYKTMCDIICRKYEDLLRMYDGSIAAGSEKDTEEYKRINRVLKTVIDEMERRIKILN